LLNNINKIGIEACAPDGLCLCPYNGMDENGYFSTQDQSSDDYINNDPFSPWSTVHHCEIWPHDRYPNAVIGFQIQVAAFS
jgi:hypothetical protein